MARYVLKRLIGLVPTLLILLFFVIFMVRLLPGNVADIMMHEQAQAQSKGATARDLEHRLGLDKSVPEAFVAYSFGVLRGDLGSSLWTQTPVTTEIAKRLPVTLLLGLLTFITSTFVGIGVGVLAAVKQGSIIDAVARSLVVLGISIPHFALATLIVVMPLLLWGWSPLTVFQPPSIGLVPYLQQFLIPAIVLGAASGSTLMRLTRTQMLEVMRQDYVRTARAKGLSESTVVWVHALRNSLLPVLPLLGLQISSIIGGAVVVERVFGFPGMGSLLINSISIRDYPIVQGITLLVGVMVMLTFVVVDLAYGWLDPRTRMAG